MCMTNMHWLSCQRTSAPDINSLIQFSDRESNKHLPGKLARQIDFVRHFFQMINQLQSIVIPDKRHSSEQRSEDRWQATMRYSSKNRTAHVRRKARQWNINEADNVARAAVDWVHERSTFYFFLVFPTPCILGLGTEEFPQALTTLFMAA